MYETNKRHLSKPNLKPIRNTLQNRNQSMLNIKAILKMRTENIHTDDSIEILQLSGRAAWKCAPLNVDGLSTCISLSQECIICSAIFGGPHTTVSAVPYSQNPTLLRDRSGMYQYKKVSRLKVTKLF